ncbi:hypothetical protein FACS1894199_08560 [Bacteroidia bacterium]|nr:hypothetical protein FACS1894199_08560 [Bacteroidia bacterium]
MKTAVSTQPTFESIMAIMDRTERRQEAFAKLLEKNAIEAEKRRKKDAAEAKEQRKKDAAEAKEQRKKDAAEAKEQRKKEAAEADVRIKKIEELVFGTAKKGFDKEFDKQQTKSYAEINKILDKVAKEVGGISNNNGHFAEEYFYNALDATRKLGNIKFDFIERNRERHIGKVQDEFDIIMFNGSSVAIIEVKYRARQHSLQHLTTQKVKNFRTLYPEYADRKLYLGIASMSFNEEIINEARKLGIGVLKQKGDTIECDTEYIKAY